MTSPISTSKVGVYVDAANMYRNGGRRMRYDVLREFAARDNGELVRLNAYVSYDAERARYDYAYKSGVQNFYSTLQDFGYKVIVKEVQWYQEASGERYGKANVDLELAVDALLQSENLDRVLLATGDGDFVQVITALQNRGCRVEVVGLDNVSLNLRREADMFMSGYLIPNLIPINNNGNHHPLWGECGSRVRGICYYHNDQGYGFIRFMKRIESGLWLTDTRHPDSPFETVFFHDSYLPGELDASLLPSRHHILEFDLVESPNRDDYQAQNIKLVSRLHAD